MTLSRNVFVNQILEAINIPTAPFMEVVKQKEHLYETMLYQWINKLYDHQKSVEEAQRIIFKARRIYYFKKMKYGR